MVHQKMTSVIYVLHEQHLFYHCPDHHMQAQCGKVAIVGKTIKWRPCTYVNHLHVYISCVHVWYLSVQSIHNTNYPDRLGPSGNFVENSTKLICLEITGYRIEYRAVKCYGCPELQIRRG
jgi:hypothetical protein